MTEVAAVSSHVAAKPVGGAKGAHTAAGTGTGLDGAFAALLGAAGEGTFAGAALPGAEGKPGQAASDPALATGEPGTDALLGIDGETGEMLAGAGDGDSVAAKPRKGASRGKGEPADDPLLQAQAALSTALPASATTVPGQPAKASADGIAVVDPAASNAATPAQLAAATDITTVAQALTAKTDKSDDKAGKDGAKSAPAIQAAAARDQAPVQTATAGSATGQSADQAFDGQSGNGEGRDRNPEKSSSALLAANDDPALSGTADPLRDIMQSLPPVLQSQLSSVGATSGARVASTDELLGDRAIDMSVSGQWIDRMAREIATLADGTGHARFQLNPPNLGKIQVDLWHGDDKMNLRVLAETDEAARRLREGQGALEAHARVASLSLGSVSVEKSSAPLESGDKQQNQRQGADPGGNPNQQSFAQAQGQSAQGRNNSGGGLNRNGFAAVIGSEDQAEPAQDTRATRAGDPRVRFA
jgi:flagellar hook-length control protein FliK